eukprot:GHVU01006990.1.p1 GENE.GHVU01006990.1~~GHVU01006990.1.p1  ORF type:complete len:118 (+),score=14.23 GHVU01006990.1:194-547(+)
MVVLGGTLPPTTTLLAAVSQSVSLLSIDSRKGYYALLGSIRIQSADRITAEGGATTVKVIEGGGEKCGRSVSCAFPTSSSIVVMQSIDHHLNIPAFSLACTYRYVDLSLSLSPLAPP